MTTHDLLNALIRAFGLYKLYTGFYLGIQIAPIVFKQPDALLLSAVNCLVGLIIIAYADRIADWALRLNHKR